MSNNDKGLRFLAVFLCIVASIALYSASNGSPDNTAAAAPASDLEQLEMVDDHGMKVDSSGKIALDILYVAHPGTARTKDFTSFLKLHFSRVQTGDLEAFSEKQAQKYDVIILDYDRNKFEFPRPRLCGSFAKPVVTLGVAGGLMCSSWQLKTGYL